MQVARQPTSVLEQIGVLRPQASLRLFREQILVLELDCRLKWLLAVAVVGYRDARLRIRPGVRRCRIRVDLGSERARETQRDKLLDLWELELMDKLDIDWQPYRKGASKKPELSIERLKEKLAKEKG